MKNIPFLCQLDKAFGHKTHINMTQQDLPEIVVPYIVMAVNDGKHKAVFGVPSEMASTMVQHPVLCRGGCFHLEIDAESEGDGSTTFLSAVFDSIEAEKTAEAISSRLAIRLEEPVPLLDAGSMLGMGSS